jgi:Ala-tRNA(Pro) deacylase
VDASVTSRGREASSVELTSEYLEGRGIPYKLLDHEERFSAVAEARACGVAPHNAAKSVILRHGEEYRLAVIPASRRLDLKKLGAVLGANGELRLATEREMAVDFPELEVGAIPPLGSMLHAPEVLDERLLEHRRILCNAGDHRHSMLLDPRDIADLPEVQVGEICEH